MPDKGKKTRVKDQHEDHNHIYETLGDEMKGFLDEVYLLDGGKYKGIRLTSGKRDASPSGKFSHHHEGDAVDFAALNQGGVLGNELYSRLMNTEDGLVLMSKYGLGIYDETDPANLAKTKGTGAHFHIGKDEGLFSNTRNRLGVYNTEGKVPQVKSFYASNQGFDYSDLSSYKETEGKSYDQQYFENPGTFEVTHTDASKSRTFTQDIKREKDKGEETDKKVSESKARKNIEKAKAQMLKAEQEKKASFIKMLSDFAAPEAPREERKKAPFRENKFDMVDAQMSMPKLPSIHTLPDFNKFEEGGVNMVQGVDPTDPPKKTKKQLEQEQYFSVLNQIRSRYKHLDPETQRRIDLDGDNYIDYGGKKKFRSVQSKSVPIVVDIDEEDKRYRVKVGSTPRFKPDFEKAVDMGVTFGDNDNVKMVFKEDERYGNEPIIIGTGPASQAWVKDFQKKHLNFAVDKRNRYGAYYDVAPRTTGKDTQKTEQAYYDWRQGQLGNFDSGVQEQKYGGVFSYEDGGEVKSPGYGWEYKKVGNDYLTRKTPDNATYTKSNDRWIVAKEGAKDAIKSKIFDEASPTPKITPERLKEVKSKLKTFNPKKTKDKASIERTQKMLVEAGYDLGNFGPKGKGIDGKFGKATRLALESFNSGIKPKHVPKPKTKAIVKEEAKEEKALVKKNKELKKGVLPRFVTGTWREECTKDKGCSGATSRKMAELFGGVSNDLWADDAWFNRDSWEKKGAEVIYETSERNLSKMQKVPKELYDKFQIGDYVSLNRSGQQYEGKEHKYDKSTKNEKTEHLGFIIGKDEDGTPLVWHGSDMGTGYVQRIDEKITLDDHGTSISHYQIASVTRNPNLIGKDKELEELGRTKFWTRNQGASSEAIDEKHILIPTENASLTQKQRAKTVNESIGQFKALGYSQEDIAYVGQLLVGGIMKMESSKGNNLLVPAKEAAAVALKDTEWFGFPDTSSSPNLTPQGILKNAEASRGIYQMKPIMNFYDAEGNINERGQELEKLGIIPDDLMQGDSDAQTKAGMLILLNNYNDIKGSENYDAETDMYNGKIPAGYVLAKTWQAGPGWYKKDKYKNVLNELNVDYSDGALEAAVDNIAIGGEAAEEPGWAGAIWRSLNGLPFELNPTGKIDEEGDYKNLGTDNEAALAERAKIVEAKREQEREERRVNEAEWAKRNSTGSILYESPDETTSVNLNLPPMPAFTGEREPDYAKYFDRQRKDGAEEEASKARNILSKVGIMRDGGEVNSDSFIDLELTDEEIKRYEQGGYKIEYL